MLRTAKLTCCLAFSLAASVAAPLAVGSPNQINLPPETATLRTSGLPGYALATQKCLVCHSADYVNYQAPGMNLAQWTAEVAKMRHAFGAPLNDDEVKSIGAYLAVAYGAAKADDAGVVEASTASKPASAPDASPGAAIDVQALLNANACLACHAIDKKMLGPAFRDVSVKYKGDAQAPSMLAASIQKGGVGKWGQIPMPPMTGLNDAEAKALAEFALKQ